MAKNDNDNQIKIKVDSIIIKYFKIVLVLEIILILNGGFFLLLKPKYIHLRTEVSKEVELKKIQLADKEKTRQELKRYQDKIEALSPLDKERLDIFLPVGVQLPELLVQLNSLAKDSNLSLDSVEVTERKVKSFKKDKETAITKEINDDGPAKGLINILDVSLSLSGGDYFSFKRFLKNMETNLRLFDEVAISFISESFNYVINLKTYYRSLADSSG